MVVAALFMILKARNRRTADNVRFHNLGNIVGSHAGVERAVRINDHDRTECAQTETTRGYNLDFLFKIMRRQFLFQFLAQCVRAGRSTTRTAADQDMFAVAVDRFVNALADRNRVLQRFVSCLKISNRCNFHLGFSPPQSMYFARMVGTSALVSLP